MNQKWILKIFILLSTVSLSYPQLTIEACWSKAADHYPLSRQQKLLDDLERLNRVNNNTGYLPQISISGKGAYQSDVMQLPVSLPGIDEISKDQYMGSVEITQTVWDGGVTGSQKKILAASSQVDKQKHAIDIYMIRDRVNRLFFGILLTEEQLKQNSILQNELQTNYKRISALMQNGLASQADIDAIRVEQLNAEQRRIELSLSMRSYRQMLSEMTGEPVNDSVSLVKPDYNGLNAGYDSINRPEIGFFEAKTGLLMSQKSAIIAGILPKISLFGQGNIGRPGVNIFENEFSEWFVGGVRLGWGLGGLYSLKNNYSKIENGIQAVRIQQEAFLFNTKQQVIQQKNEIEKYREILKSDDEIIALRSRVKDAARARVENGTMSISDLIKEINAEDLAIQNKSLHGIQLLMSIFNLKNTLNN